MNDYSGCALVLAVLCLVAGILMVPFIFVADTEVPRAYRALLVILPLSLSAFLAVLGFKMSDGQLPGPVFWLLLVVPLALCLHYCS